MTDKELYELHEKLDKIIDKQRQMSEEIREIRSGRIKTFVFRFLRRVSAIARNLKIKYETRGMTNDEITDYFNRLIEKNYK